MGVIKLMENRIKNDALAPYISLTKAELEHYAGTGYAIAYIDAHNEITELEYVEEIEEDGAENAINRALGAGAWFGLCSATQFCEPRKFSTLEAAKTVRLVAENYDLN